MNLWKEIHYQRLESFLDKLNEVLREPNGEIPLSPEPQGADSSVSHSDESTTTAIQETTEKTSAISPPNAIRPKATDEKSPSTPSTAAEEGEATPSTAPDKVSDREEKSTSPSSREFFGSINWNLSSPSSPKTASAPAKDSSGEETPPPQKPALSDPERPTGKSFFSRVPWENTKKTPPTPEPKDQGGGEVQPVVSAEKSPEAAPSVEEIPSKPVESNAKGFFGNLNWEGRKESWETLEQAPDRAPPVKVAAQRKTLPRDEKNSAGNPLLAATRSAMVTSRKFAETPKPKTSESSPPKSARSFFNSVRWTKH
ncbi:MAG: hypothetical protein JJT75_07030 [Opitutales bacterium]|nr:hypothetical protein [Opitutales bacterium]MCH8539430.1 hypothetical protein [Opitutales bacterium]